jgi:hypothetical protein
MTRAEEFERLRPLLLAIAYRILGQRERGPSTTALVLTAIIDGYFFLGGILYGRAARSCGPALSLRWQARRASQQGERVAPDDR